jgi:Ca2+-binding RTX toxin-like protein
VSATQASCTTEGPARWVMADLGPGNDSLVVEGSLAGAQNVRLAGGLGNDTIRGGDEDDLIEAGYGSDRLYGGAGADGLIGSRPGPTFLYGGPEGDLLAAGGGCAGGALVGGPGRDDASFA